jgi:DNA-binding transcriptional LysR family regulator
MGSIEQYCCDFRSNTRMDKLKAMRAFVRIVDAGSLTAAAAQLDTSLASVVRSLAALEDALQARLLHRTTRRIALTEEGRDYYERCRRLLADIDEAEAALTARQVTPAGRIAITAPVQFGRLHVEPVLLEFMSAHPGVSAELLLLDRVVDLLEEGMDLAVRIGNQADSALVAIPVGAARRLLCASPAYLARHGIPKSPAALAAHRGIRFTGSGGSATWEFVSAGKVVRATTVDVFSTNHVQAALDACAAGIGLARFLSYQCRELVAAGRLVTIMKRYDPPPLPVNITYPPSRLLSSRVRAFLDWAVPRLRSRLMEF